MQSLTAPEHSIPALTNILATAGYDGSLKYWWAFFRYGAVSIPEDNLTVGTRFWKGIPGGLTLAEEGRL